MGKPGQKKKSIPLAHNKSQSNRSHRGEGLAALQKAPVFEGNGIKHEKHQSNTGGRCQESLQPQNNKVEAPVLIQKGAAKPY